MESIVKIAGIGLIAVFCALLLKERYRVQSVVISVAAFLLVLVLSLDGPFSETIATVMSYADESGFSSNAVVLVKALGIAYIAGITENICLEAGENSVGAAIAFGAKTELIILSLPLISSILEMAKNLMTL